jgi:hypothetical protein
LQPTPKVGSLADIGLGIRILAAQEKHCRSGGGGKDLGVSFRMELDAFGQHLPILIRINGKRLTTEDTGRHRGKHRGKRQAIRSSRS